MHHTLSKLATVSIAAALALTLPVSLEGVDVHVEHDKTVDFQPLKTWAWNTQAGDVKMGRTQQDNPEAMRKRVEPLVMETVATEMTRLGMKQTGSAPGLTLAYFLLLTLDTETQTLGQFLPAAPMWGLPPFAPATQSLKMMNRGSLVLDMNANGVVVWRGVAQAGIEMGTAEKKREDLLRRAVKDLLKRFPPKR